MRRRLWGMFLKWDGTAWFTATRALFDITGKSPDDLWVVGAGGYVLHWYE